MKKTRMNTKDIVNVALFAALALVFKVSGKLIPVLVMPNGGSIEIEMIILATASFILGYKKGIITALIYWVLAFMFNEASYFINIFQYCCDYFIPILSVGACSLFTISSIKNPLLKKELAIFIAFFIKYISHVLSGVYFYFPEGEVAGSLGAWLYSLSYNSGYVVVSMVITMILVPLILSRLKQN